MRYQKIHLKGLAMVLTLALCVLGAHSLPAHADKGGNGHGHSRGDDNGDDQGRENSQRHDEDNQDDHDGHKVVFEDNDRVVINNYMHKHHYKNCPPGLAKKHNGCLPPGHARRYEVGQRLPDDVTYVQVPYSLRHNLRPVEPGYEYVRVDNDVLLMSKSDKVIVDAVTLMTDLAQ